MAIAIGLSSIVIMAKAEIQNVFPTEAMNVQPKLRFPWSPSYPDELKQTGTEGRVTVEFIVSKDGAVRYPRILKSSHPAFEKPVIDAVWKWRYVPGRKDGQTVNCRVSQSFEFQSDGNGGHADQKT